ncbi:MAG: carbamoyl phosphate synthase large subunit, partial [Actinobacteria bacterium]|nr:carbamoyl phosphate synthase large subunit [Actinomycetota bacterium]
NHKFKFLESVKKVYELGLPIYATKNTADFLNKNNVKTKSLYKLHENKSPNVLEYFQQGKIDFAVNVVDSYIKKIVDDDYALRRSAIDHNIPLFTNRQKADLFIRAVSSKKLDDLLIKSWDEYVK